MHKTIPFTAATLRQSGTRDAPRCKVTILSTPATVIYVYRDAANDQSQKQAFRLCAMHLKHPPEDPSHHRHHVTARLVPHARQPLLHLELKLDMLRLNPTTRQWGWEKELARAECLAFDAAGQAIVASAKYACIPARKQGDGPRKLPEPASADELTRHELFRKQDGRQQQQPGRIKPRPAAPTHQQHNHGPGRSRSSSRSAMNGVARLGNGPAYEGLGAFLRQVLSFF